MPDTLFIADLHLQSTQPNRFTTCLTFLSEQASQAEALYILGDLFEMWVGDDDTTYQPILTALRNLTYHNIPVFVLRGNRDFLLGANFEANTGCRLLADATVINLYGEPTLLMHGDTLCTKDTVYQTFRQQVRDPQWQRQFLAQPLTQRYHLAQQAREQSQLHTQTLTDELTDATMTAVEAEITKHQVRHLIHGHTHKPALQQWTLANQTVYRWVLGAWDDQGGIILRCSPTHWQLAYPD